MKTHHRILLIDDEPCFRQGVRMFLEFYNTQEECSLEVCGEAESVEQALSQAAQLQPSLVFLDLELVAESGFNILMHLREIVFCGKIMVLSAHQEDDWIFRSIQAGATGYVFKNRLLTQLPEAMKAICQSQIYLPPEATNGFFRQFHKQERFQWDLRRQLCLTNREQDVLNCLAQGSTNEEIASRLYVTVATVKAHLTNVFEKLEVKNRTQAIVKASRLGLIQS